MNAHLQRAYWSREKRIVPGLYSAQANYAEMLERYVQSGTRWLDIGCGHQLFERWIKTEHVLVRRASLVVGCDPDHSSQQRHRSIDHRIVESTLPLRSASFSLITANMVLEHICDPLAFFAEAKRLLRAGGHLIVHTPNARHWQVWASRMLPSRLKACFDPRSRGTAAKRCLSHSLSRQYSNRADADGTVLGTSDRYHDALRYVDSKQAISRSIRRRRPFARACVSARKTGGTA